MFNRTEWFVVDAQIALRDQAQVQYAQDDVKIETLPGVTVHPFTFLLELNDHQSDEHRKDVFELFIKNHFRFNPKLTEGVSASYELKEVSFKKVNGVFQATTK